MYKRSGINHKLNRLGLALGLWGCLALPTFGLTGQASAAESLDKHLPDEIDGVQNIHRQPGLNNKHRKIIGTPGSPDTKTTIDGKQLPPPPDKTFGGKIERNAIDSTPYWPPRIVPPEGAPNVLLIMTDDAGYGVSSTFGGVIPTPAMDRVANEGIRYTHFHSTSVCSPTRAALITGRNHHQVGTGSIPELSTGYPGYNSIMTKDKATIARILKGHGYVTSWLGKNHNTQDLQVSKIGPYYQWPIGLGFD